MECSIIYVPLNINLHYKINMGYLLYNLTIRFINFNLFILILLSHII